ncbi:MAG: hypothetical protein KAJ66_04510 [Candidatus Omnitrophica bacterium]|nr:hypothetical protein [Candidatus Omnitrophota bacterium]
MKIAKIFILALAFFSFAQAARGDIVYLKNGAQYQGEVLRETPDQVMIRLKIGVLTIDRKDVESVKREIKKVEPEEEIKTLTKDESILEELKKASEDIISYKCDMRVELYDKSIIKGNLLFMRPDNMKANYSVWTDKEGMGRLIVTALSDGKVFWMYYPQLNVAYRQDAFKSNAFVPGGDELLPSALIEKLIENGCRVLEEDIIGGDKVYCIEGAGGEFGGGFGDVGQKMAVAKCRLWLRIADGFLVKSVGYSEQGDLLFITKNMDIETNIEVEKAEFSFQLPENVQVIDSAFLKDMEKLFDEEN